MSRFSGRKAEEGVEISFAKLVRKNPNASYTLKASPKWMSDFTKYILTRERYAPLTSKTVKKEFPKIDSEPFIKILLTTSGPLPLKMDVSLKTGYKFEEVNK